MDLLKLYFDKQLRWELKSVMCDNHYFGYLYQWYFAVKPGGLYSTKGQITNLASIMSEHCGSYWRQNKKRFSEVWVAGCVHLEIYKIFLCGSRKQEKTSSFFMWTDVYGSSPGLATNGMAVREMKTLTDRAIPTQPVCSSGFSSSHCLLSSVLHKCLDSRQGFTRFHSLYDTQKSGHLNKHK